MIIYVDPGHGGVWPNGDPGVVTEDGKKIESYYNWVYANHLVEHLERKGFDAKLTRTQDEYKIPYSDRTKNAKSRDILISLHFDTYIGGRRMIYYGQQERSRELAEKIDTFFGSNDLRASTTSRFGRLYIDDADSPSVLVEVDRIDRATLDKSFIAGFCEDITRGIESFIGYDVDETDNSGQIEEESPQKQIKTPFTRVFIVNQDNTSSEVPVNRMSIVGDKLYIAPDKIWFE